MIVGSALLASALALPLAPSAPETRSPAERAPMRLVRPGDSGPSVRALQRRLKALHYDPGSVNGYFGQETRDAVWAFQKVNRMTPNSVVGKRTWAALARPRQPKALVPSGPGTRVEISLRRQLLFAYRKGRLVLITHVSTGSGSYYCGPTGCGRARTPVGDFRVYRRIRGWHRSPLGYMYRPLYFHGGYAMHGSVRVPRRPASHGCVRLPLHTADVLPRLIKRHERVYIRA